ncbi:MAG TPA: class I SAM-dependent methyltransferase [Nannocystis sp.]
MTLWPRMHLFEFHDRSWCPALLRQAVTDCVTTAWSFTGLWRNTVPHLVDLLRRAGTDRIIDLCSGSGGPLPLAISAVAQEVPGVTATLTDLYPKPGLAEDLLRRSGGRLTYHRAPVDAMAVPAELRGVRTIFGAFHHFAPKAAVQLLRGASAAGQPIAIFEFQRRDFLRNCVPPTGLVGLSPWIALLLAPHRWWRAPLTILPVIPAVYAWDSVVTILRTYTPEELAALAREASLPGYRWEVRDARGSGRARITCLAGFPDERGGVEVLRF